MQSRQAWTYESGILWMLDAHDKPTAVEPRIDTSFAEVQQARAEELAAAMGLSSADPVKQRFAAGKRCFAGWSDGCIATYGWISQEVQSIGELERELRLQPGEAYIWDCATLPAYRGKRLYSALLAYIVSELRGEGLNRIWIGSAYQNRPSWHGFANAGFHPVLSVTYARFLKLSLILIRGDRQASAEAIATARRAVLRSDEQRIGPLAFAWR